MSKSNKIKRIYEKQSQTPPNGDKHCSFYVKGHHIMQVYNIYNSCVEWLTNNSVLTFFVSVPFPPLVEQRSQRSVVCQI